MERIEADLLIPGTGEPIRDGLVVLDGPTITYAGPAADAPPTPQAPSTRAATVLPGLWDCHGHLLGTRSPGPGPPAAGAARPAGRPLRR
jgi:imidazolonepropionase-like amidohydrolase